MDTFSFFFSFYGLILGLAVTELLGGFGNVVRAGVLRKLGAQTALLALFVLVVICATWIDAWHSMRNVPLDFEGLWAPLLIAILYYLAATITFPRDPAQWPSIDDYYATRKRFVVGAMLAAEFVVNYTFRGVFIGDWEHNRPYFWQHDVLFNVAIKLAFVALFFAKGRRANIAALLALDALFVMIYWVH
jgi:hypothetical protein